MPNYISIGDGITLPSRATNHHSPYPLSNPNTARLPYAPTWRQVRSGRPATRTQDPARPTNQGRATNQSQSRKTKRGCCRNTGLEGVPPVGTLRLTLSYLQDLKCIFSRSRSAPPPPPSRGVYSGLSGEVVWLSYYIHYITCICNTTYNNQFSGFVVLGRMNETLKDWILRVGHALLRSTDYIHTRTKKKKSGYVVLGRLISDASIPLSGRGGFFFFC